MILIMGSHLVDRPAIFINWQHADLRGLGIAVEDEAIGYYVGKTKIATVTQEYLSKLTDQEYLEFSRRMVNNINYYNRRHD